MGKALFLNFPTHGCINPLLATAAELVNRGEQIIYYCTEEFRSKIEQTGSEFRPYKGLINTFKMPDADLFKALKLNIGMSIDKLDHNLDVFENENADYILHDSLCTWGKYTAKTLKIPAINLMHSFPIIKSSISLSSDTAALLLRVGFYKVISELSKNSPKKQLKNKYDIYLSLSDILINKEDLNIVYTSRHMEPDIHQSEKNYTFVGPSLFFKKEEYDFPFDQLKGKKVVYISLGTLISDNPTFYKKCIKAFLNKDYFVVIAIGFDVDLNEFGDLPKNFLIRQSVPQQRLLEHVDVFITHAGMNSVNEAICHGVPMLSLPHTFEQKLIAKRVCEMGIGRTQKINGITSAKIYESTRQLISEPGIKKQALKYKAIFSKEEKVSHIKAADKILEYTINV